MSHREEELLQFVLGLSVVLPLAFVFVRWLLSPPGDWLKVQKDLRLALRHEKTGSIAAAHTSSWILEGTLDRIPVVARETREFVGKRRAHRFVATAQVRVPFSEKTVESLKTWTLVREGSWVRVQGPTTFSAKELEFLIRQTVLAARRQNESTAAKESTAAMTRPFGRVASSLRSSVGSSASRIAAACRRWCSEIRRTDRIEFEFRGAITNVY